MSDRYFRRGHWVRKSAPKGKKGSGWVILAVIIGAGWLWGTSADEQDPPQKPSSVSESVAPAQAPVPDQGEDELPPPEPTGAP